MSQPRLSGSLSVSRPRSRRTTSPLPKDNPALPLSVSCRCKIVTATAPVTQTAPAPTAPATSPELVQQLEAMARHLAVLRRSVEEFAAKQEHLSPRKSSSLPSKNRLPRTLQNRKRSSGTSSTRCRPRRTEMRYPPPQPRHCLCLPDAQSQTASAPASGSSIADIPTARTMSDPRKC